MERILVPRSAVGLDRVLVLAGSQDNGLGLAETTSVDVATVGRHGPKEVGLQLLLAFLAQLIGELTGASKDEVLPQDGSSHQGKPEDVPNGIPQVHGEALDAPHTHDPVRDRAARGRVEGRGNVPQAVRGLNQLTFLSVEPLKQREEKIGPHVGIGLVKNMIGAERLNLPASRTSQTR